MPAETLSPARVVRLAAEMIRRDAEVFLLLGLLLAGLPSWMAGLVAPVPADPDAMLTDGELLRVMLANLVVVVLSGVLQVILVHRAWTQAEGQPLPLRAGIDRALRLLPALVGLMLLEGLAVGLGLVFLVVPGIILLCCWAVSLPVLALQPPAGPVEALRRSTEMTRGHRWAVLTLGVIFVGLNAAVLIVAWFAAALLLMAGPLSVFAGLAGVVANAAVSVATAAGMAALYRELLRIGPATA